MEGTDNNGLTVILEKYTWGAAEIEFLEISVGRHDISIPEVCVAKLKQFKKQKSVKQLHSFFGILIIFIVSLIYVFIPNY